MFGPSSSYFLAPLATSFGPSCSLSSKNRQNFDLPKTWQVLNLKKYKVASNLIFFSRLQVPIPFSLLTYKKSGVDKPWFFKSNISVQIKLASNSFSYPEASYPLHFAAPHASFCFDYQSWLELKLKHHIHFTLLHHMYIHNNNSNILQNF